MRMITVDEDRRVTREQGLMLQAVGCVVTNSQATYVSGPITTGNRFSAWYASTGRNFVMGSQEYLLRLTSDVIQPNEKAIHRVASAIRERSSVPVIEPASLAVPDWSQQEYLSFWLRIIQKFVSTIVLVSGWEFSVGCATEFRCASRLGLPILDELGNCVGSQQGEALITAAATRIEQIAEGAAPLIQLAQVLRNHRI
ncbi:DUF4406 domain-containing protein [Achromobacter seleniivolatilans]|uniref:DUF4406 domain-containing protein n=1 Tax=Achromobacter seleniivolatilans TaxID=3047478 RepID=A0ABY9M958_9BURK|nr:DUF4406 domain-containing protein [Achromobacter sp. R39]WMD22723.1 DUF4406 domain-containing protein [Achromobacter sp. R39]